MKGQTINVHRSPNKYVVANAAVATVLVVGSPAYTGMAYAIANQYEWIKHGELNTREGYFSTSAISADGNHIILGVMHGGEGDLHDTSPLIISNNYGTSWENVASVIDPDIRNHWASVDVSNDGEVMVAASEYRADVADDSVSDGGIYVSEDSGDTWQDKTPADIDAGATNEWEEVVVSGDGSKIAAIREGDVFSGEEQYLVVSEDGGDTWQDVSVALDVDTYGLNLKSLSISDNGDTILVGGENTNGPDTSLFLTEDNGDTWADITPNTEEGAWDNNHDISADGSKMVVATNDGSGNSVYLIENDGVLISPTEVTYEEAAGTPWTDVAISDDGSTLTAIDEYDGENGKMFISTNDGATWAEEAPGQQDEDMQFMASVDTNQDGSQFIVAGEDYVYTNSISSPETESTVTFDDAVGGKTITLTTPSGTTITCHSGVKESGLSTKDIAYSYPLGLVDFCFSGADTTNEIRIVFTTDLKPDEVTVRKYNPENDQYTTVSDATVTETTSEGQPALEVVYDIVDNGPLDTDPDIGEVADPIGLGITEIAAPNTGLEKSQRSDIYTIAPMITGLTVATGVLVSQIRRRVINRKINFENNSHLSKH